jgi:fatty acid desaturase
LPVDPGLADAEAPPTNPLHRLSAEQLTEIGERFDAIHAEVAADLGAVDAAYIRGLIAAQRRLEMLSRLALAVTKSKGGWLAGVAGLSVAKILENMEIGHNVMHGQYDFMRDPSISSLTWEWDTASTAKAWKHSHNYLHHTFTNIVGKDKDVGYEVFRVDPKQEWEPWFLTQPIVNVLLMVGFEWGIAVHDLDFDAIEDGTKDMAVLREEILGIVGKAAKQILKDYIAFPLLSRRPKRTLVANVAANAIRNTWANAIIFCGHFPDQAYTFTEEEAAGETRGGWYVRQLLGSVNIDGGDVFHLMSGNLSYQVEHHLFPDIPSRRYKELAPRVKAICEEFGLPYNTGPFGKQWLMVQRTILRLAFPGGGPRPKAPPYVAPAAGRPGERPAPRHYPFRRRRATYAA